MPLLCKKKFFTTPGNKYEIDMRPEFIPSV